MSYTHTIPCHLPRRKLPENYQYFMCELPMDRFTYHRAALFPLTRLQNKRAINAEWSMFDQLDKERLIAFILQNNLGAMWYEYMSNSAPSQPSLESIRKHLQSSHVSATIYYERQHALMTEINELFGSVNITHAFFKGAHTREWLYANPACRTCCDLDVLIQVDDLSYVTDILVNNGYKLQTNTINLSHEASFTKHNVDIDIHWDILRPGRIRKNIVPRLLETRQYYDSYWGLDTEANAFLMLVHPVFTKYTNSRNATLDRIADILHMLHQQKVDWNKVDNWLTVSATKTAAWTTLCWLDKLQVTAKKLDIEKKILPSRMKRAYLKYWIDHHLSERLLDYPPSNQLLFTLPVHDSISDACRATGMMFVSRFQSRKRIKTLNPETQTSH